MGGEPAIAAAVARRKDRRRRPSVDAVRISARNQLPGTVVAVDHGAVMSIVTIRLAGGQEVVAAITKDSAESLELEAGDEVAAIIKSTEVMVAKP